MEEEWRAVPGYEGTYAVSNLGRIRSITRKIAQGNRWGGITVRTFKGKVLSQQFDRSVGYWQINFYEAGHETKCFRIHVLVCTAFNGPKPSPDHEVNHKNGVKTDNHPGNLEWMTHPQNNRHAFMTGLNLGMKLSDEDVAEVRKLWDAGGKTQDEIAAKFGVSQPTISAIVNYKERSAPIHLPRE